VRHLAKESGSVLGLSDKQLLGRVRRETEGNEGYNCPKRLADSIESPRQREPIGLTRLR
jgi:hypothetical protein